MKQRYQFTRLFLISILALVFLQVCAQNDIRLVNDSDILRVDKIFTSNHMVKIDSVWRSRGYFFRASQKIELNENEYIEFTNLSTGRPQLRVCNKDFNNKKKISIFDVFSARMLGTKGIQDSNDPINSYPSKYYFDIYPWNMIEDTLLIPTNYILDEIHGFILKTIPGNKILEPVPFDYTTNELILSKDYFLENGILLEDGKDYQFRLEYWEGDSKSEVITDYFIIHYVPIFKENTDK